jgi:alpha-mannosidase
MDQGEHVFRFWINAGRVEQRLDAIDRESLVKNESPCVMSFYPSGTGKKDKANVLWSLDDKVIVAVAAKKAENDNSLILRLFEPTGKSRTSTLLLPGFTKRVKLKFAPFEIKTLKISPNGSVKQVDLLERSYQKGN